MRVLFCNSSLHLGYRITLFLIFLSFGISGRLCFLTVAFVNIFTSLFCIVLKHVLSFQISRIQSMECTTLTSVLIAFTNTSAIDNDTGVLALTNISTTDNDTNVLALMNTSTTENGTGTINVNLSSETRVFAASLHWLSCLSMVLSVVLVPVGLFGNISIIRAVKNVSNEKYPHRMYMMALALVDMTSLIFTTGNRTFLQDLFGVDIRAITVAGCKIYVYIYRVSITCCSFIVSLICVERFIMVCFPLKSRLMLTKKTTGVSLCAVFAIPSLLLLPTVIFTDVRNNVCTPETQSPSIVAIATVVLVQIMYSVIPTVILLSLTPLTLIKLYKVKQLRKRLTNRTVNNNNHNTTMMLMSVIISYICFITIPSLVLGFLNLNAVNVLGSTDHLATIVKEFISSARQINYSINWVIYGVRNDELRRQFYNLFCRSRQTERPTNTAQSEKNT